MKFSLPIRLRAALLSCLLALPSLTVAPSFGRSIVIIPDEAADTTEAESLLAPTLGDDSAYFLDPGHNRDMIMILTEVFNSQSYEYNLFIYSIVINSLGDEGAANTAGFDWVFLPDGSPFLEPTSSHVPYVTVSYPDQNRVHTLVTPANINRSFVGIESTTAINGGAIQHDVPSLTISIGGDLVTNKILVSTSTSDVVIRGGALYNASEISTINSHFVANILDADYASSDPAYIAHSYGGAIYNHADASIGGLRGDFIANKALSSSDGFVGNDEVNDRVSTSVAGAVYNEGIMGNITGDFIYNLAKATATNLHSSDGVNAYGGAIYNSNTMGDITSDFNENNAEAKSVGGYAYAYGGAIHNEKDLGHIKGDYILNETIAESSLRATAQGGAISSAAGSTIDSIQANFSGNRLHAISSEGGHAYAKGGAVYSQADIELVTGYYLSNVSQSISERGDASSSGGALYNVGEISEIHGYFFSNRAVATSNTGSTDATGGAISNENTITSIKGYFVGNNVLASSSSFGGALYNTGTITNLSSDFIGNVAHDASDTAQVEGGGIYNKGSIGLLALQNDIEFTGNHTNVDQQKSSNAIHNAGLFDEATIRFNAYGEKQIIVNDGISGNDMVTAPGGAITEGKPLQILEINSGLDGEANPIDAQGASFSTVSFNNSIEQQTINIYGGTLVLGEYAGGSYSYNGSTFNVEASHAALIDSDLNIKEGGHVMTHASYLAQGYVSNEGELTLTGGTLDTQDGKISGTGKINLTSVVQNNVAIETRNLSMSNKGDDYGALYSSATGTLTLRSGSTVELSIIHTRPTEGFRWTILQYGDHDLVTSYYDLAAMITINGASLENTAYFLERGVDGLSYSIVDTEPELPSFASFSTTANGLAGNVLLDQVTQQSVAEGRDLGTVMDEIYLSYTSSGQSASTGDQLAAAVAGAGVASLGSAMMSSMEMQLQRVLQRSGSLVNEGKGNYWIAAEGSLSELESAGTYAGHRLSSWGGSLGAEYGLREDTSLSIGLVALYGELEANSADRAEGDFDSYYLSAAAYHQSGNWVHQGLVSAGLLDASLHRSVTHASGGYNTTGSTDGYSLGIMYELGYEIELRENTTLIPVINAALMHGSLDGYTEAGSDAALRVNEVENTYATFGLGARLSTRSSTGIQTSLRALIKIDAGSRQQGADIGLRDIAGTHTTIHGQDAGALGGELGLGVSVPVSAQSSVFLNTMAEIRRDQHSFNGSVGYRLSF